jgi:hypothetical protein
MCKAGSSLSWEISHCTRRSENKPHGFDVEQQGMTWVHSYPERVAAAKAVFATPWTCMRRARRIGRTRRHEDTGSITGIQSAMLVDIQIHV